ncbi:MAG: Uma2 family endonuclease [Pseudanabaena sp. ELA645]|jgi:Uma2 family endonuclease
MTTSTLSKSNDTNLEQRLLLPRNYSWQEFVVLENLLVSSGSFRITYLDGWIELMTVGEPHELIKKSLAILLEAYFIEMGIEFIPVGNATRRGEEKGTSFEPDESYYLGAKKANPDLAIEVILTSGSIEKLEKYRRFKIPEVWLWENNQLFVYALISSEYRLVNYSQLLPDLDLELLARCVLMPSRLEAMNAFKAGMRY